MTFSQETADALKRMPGFAVTATPSKILTLALTNLVAACRKFHDDTGHDEVSSVQCDYICEEMRKAENVLLGLGCDPQAQGTGANADAPVPTLEDIWDGLWGITTEAELYTYGRPGHHPSLDHIFEIGWATLEELHRMAGTPRLIRSDGYAPPPAAATRSPVADLSPSGQTPEEGKS